jgi:hypothetical protein
VIASAKSNPKPEFSKHQSFEAAGADAAGAVGADAAGAAGAI